jgi:hypothetical protein
MNLRTSPSYNLRQLQLPREYQLRLQTVKHRIALITGKVPSIETVIMAMIDEFLNLHGGGDYDASTDARGNIDLRTPTSNGGSND